MSNDERPRVTVRIPPPLRAHAGDAAELVAAGATVGEALTGLATSYPELGQRLLTPEGSVRPYVNVFVGEQALRALGGLDAPLAGGEVVAIIPAVAGGTPGAPLLHRVEG